MRWQYMQQAYVSVRAPLGSGLTIDAGKFVTPAGAEVIETAGQLELLAQPAVLVGHSVLSRRRARQLRRRATR